VHATSLEADGLNPDGTIQVPSVKQPQVLGYYTRGAAPCTPGPQQVPFTLLGHIDGSHQKGVLYYLKNLKAGDLVTVGLDNGKSCTYRITKLVQISKDPKNKTPNTLSWDSAEAKDLVWGPKTQSQINLISCGGPFVGGKLGYADNLVGIGTLVT